MPIHEFHCADCRRDVEILVRGSGRPSCPRCSGKHLRRLLSTFAMGGGPSAPASSAPSRSKSCRGGCGGCHGCR
ncbi:MAG: FmdB family zinc ribbon protein [Planctomycetota bacterium]